MIRKELLTRQLQDKGGAHITIVFCENEMGLALSFQMGFTDVISKQKARPSPDSPEQSALNLSCSVAVTAPS